MNRKEIEMLMKDVFTSSEAAEFLNISTQRLNQLVHENKLVPIKTSKSVMLFLRQDLQERKVTNVINTKDEQCDCFDVNLSYVRDAILYFTIQQYFNNNDKKTCEFIEIIKNSHSFKYSSGLKENIPLLSSLLNTTDAKFYETYQMVKESFQSLSSDVVLSRKGDEIYSKLLMMTEEAPPYLFFG